MLNTFRLAVKLLWRESRAGEWIILFFALLFSVAAITTLNFYTDRIKAGLNQQSNRLLGGDLAVISARPISASWEKQATELKLQHAQIWAYPSVIRGGEQFQIVSIQAVSDNYPLLGDTSLRPALGTLWVERRLLPLLNITMNDAVMVGDAQFAVAKELSADNEAFSSNWTMAPRVLMRLRDVPATKTVLPGSRVEYRLLLAGDRAALDRYRAWITPKLLPGQRLVTVRDQQLTVRTALERAEGYLQLIMLVCIVMAGVVIALSIHQYIRRHYAYVALLRCLGMTYPHLIRVFFYQLLIISLLAGIAGIVTGYVAQGVIARLFANILPVQLAAAGFTPMMKGLITSLFLLFSFAYPLVSELANASPLRLWRVDALGKSFPSYLYFVVLVTGLSLLLYWIMDVTLLTLYFINMILISVGFFYAISLLFIAWTKRLLVFVKGPLKRGLSHLVQYPDVTSLQFCGLVLILMCLLTLGSIKGNLVQNWKQDLPANTPNYFLFNIAPTDLTALAEKFKQYNMPLTHVYPMVRGRLVALNDKPIMQAVSPLARQYNALHRELNLSTMWEYPSDNVVVKGEPWSTRDKKGLSVEKSMAETLGLQIGDTLTFQMGEQRISAKILNIRSLDWSSFHPNFYVIFTPGMLDGLPMTYISSFYLSNNKVGFINDIIQRFPNATVIDITSALEQIQALIGQLSVAVQYLFLFALGLSVLLMLVAIQSSMDERRNIANMLYILGASRRYIRLSILAEFVYLLSLIVLTAFVFAKVIVFLLEKNIFG